MLLSWPSEFAVDAGIVGRSPPPGRVIASQWSTIHCAWSTDVTRVTAWATPPTTSAGRNQRASPRSPARSGAATRAVGGPLTYPVHCAPSHQRMPASPHGSRCHAGGAAPGAASDGGPGLALAGGSPSVVGGASGSGDRAAAAGPGSVAAPPTGRVSRAHAAPSKYRSFSVPHGSGYQPAVRTPSVTPTPSRPVPCSRRSGTGPRSGRVRTTRRARDEARPVPMKLGSSR